MAYCQNYGGSVQRGPHRTMAGQGGGGGGGQDDGNPFHGSDVQGEKLVPTDPRGNVDPGIIVPAEGNPFADEDAEATPKGPKATRGAHHRSGQGGCEAVPNRTRSAPRGGQHIPTPGKIENTPVTPQQIKCIQDCVQKALCDPSKFMTIEEVRAVNEDCIRKCGVLYGAVPTMGGAGTGGQNTAPHLTRSAAFGRGEMTPKQSKCMQDCRNQGMSDPSANEAEVYENCLHQCGVLRGAGATRGGMDGQHTAPHLTRSASPGRREIHVEKNHCMQDCERMRMSDPSANEAEVHESCLKDCGLLHGVGATMGGMGGQHTAPHLTRGAAPGPYHEMHMPHQQRGRRGICPTDGGQHTSPHLTRGAAPGAGEVSGMPGGSLHEVAGWLIQHVIALLNQLKQSQRLHGKQGEMEQFLRERDGKMDP